jgi:chemotaxis protein methyltransferase CheR
VAILLRHHFPALSGWTIRLIASDLSAAMVERAKVGRYSDLEVSRGLPVELRDLYFQKSRDGWLLRDNIRLMVEFRLVNMSAIWPELPFMDLVLFRNVLIYFEIPTRQRILERIRTVLQPHGYLMLGGAETTHNLHDGYIPVSFDQTSFFQLRDR